MSKKLTAKQQQFVERYLVSMNASKAYQEVYKCKSEATARANSARLLTKANILASIEVGQKEKSERNKIDQDWVLQRLIAIADGHIGKVAQFGGNTFTLKNSSDLNEEALRCLSSIKKKDKTTQFGDESEFEIRLREPVKSLELIGKHIGMWSGDSDDGSSKDDTDALRSTVSEYIKRAL